MIIDMNYWSKVLKRLIIVIFSVIGIFIGFKFAVFYMPFLIAFIISLLLEPIIRFLMKHFKLKRKVASILVFIITISIIIGFIVLGITTLVTESVNILNSINEYTEKIALFFQNIISKINLEKLNLSNEVINFIDTSLSSFLQEAGEYVKNALTKILNFITSIPTTMIYIVITFLSLYFICTDKIYMLDQFEHHFPENWVKKIIKKIRAIIKSLGQYLKAQAILVLVSFIISLIGLFIFKFIGLNVHFPLTIAIAIAFVDALPIFGSGTVMAPWAIITAFNGDITLGVAILVLWIIMSITRQLLEPKIVSGQIGIHPIFTLIAMYTGFRFIGIFGMLLGPIILIILKNVFAGLIDKGVAKSIFER